MRRTLLVVLTGLALTSPAVAQDGSLGVRLVGDGPYVVADLQHGDRLERQVEVANSTDGPLDVALYAGAATLTGEAFDFADGRDGGGVRRVSRVGVRLYVSVVEPSLLVPGLAAGTLLLLAAGSVVVGLRRR